MRHTQGQDVGKGVILATPSKPLLLRKGRWSPEEDNKLINYMMKNGNAGGWSYVARQTGLQRCGNSCRLRWINYLRPGLKRGAFSYQEEMLIIHLQSILGNRWCLIAKQLPGRTDNELKNHWNCHIKKQLQLKLHRLPSSFTTDTNAKTNRPSEWDHKCNTNLVSAHFHDAFTSSHSSQQYLDVIPEGSQPPNNAFTVLTTGENRLCVPGVLDLKHQLLQDQSDNEFSLNPNPTNNQQISCPQLDWTSATSNHTHNSFSSHAALMSPSVQAQSQHARSSTCDELIIESRRTTVAPHEAPRSADYCLGSTRITIPALVESNSLKEKIKNDENYIMMDYSNVSGPTHPYPDSADCSYVVDPGDYSTHEVGIDILKENESLYENATHQSCPTLDSRCQFRWPAGQFSDYIQSDNDRRDRPNFSYDVNLGFPAYIDISCRFKSYQLPHIEEEINANPIPYNTLMGRQEGNGPFETECNGEAGQVRDWAQDDMYNINPAAPSDLQQILLICNKSTTNL